MRVSDGRGQSPEAGQGIVPAFGLWQQVARKHHVRGPGQGSFQTRILCRVPFVGENHVYRHRLGMGRGQAFQGLGQ